MQAYADIYQTYSITLWLACSGKEQQSTLWQCSSYCNCKRSSNVHFFYWPRSVKAWELNTSRYVYRLYINAHTVFTYRFLLLLFVCLLTVLGSFLDKITVKSRCSCKESNFSFYVHTVYSSVGYSYSHILVMKLSITNIS